MTLYDPTSQSYQLAPPSPTDNRSTAPVSSSNVGNIFAIAMGQQLQAVQESAKPREVTLFNNGPLPVWISSLQKVAPNGLRLGVGSLYQFITADNLWLTTPLPLFGDTGRFIPATYVSVSVAT